jgi:hypothetical protein
MITEPVIVQRLRALGFNEGWAISGNTIVAWDNDEPQPTYEELGVTPDETPNPDSDSE